MLRILHLIPFLLLGYTVNVLAQEPVRTDTLPAAIKRASLLGRKTLPTGDPDFVKFIQTLPGVATGSDGSSSYYVRGGNMGGNVQTLDGVTIYGSPHLVGLTTAYPADIVSVAEFQVGGFTSEEGNLSASHIKLSSRDGSFDTFSAKADISNFMLGGCVSTPLVKDRLSLMASFRVSPAPFEYKAISGMIDRDAIDISNASAAIYDIYAKLKYRFDGKRSLSASFFHSRDNYKFRMNSGSEDMMSWDNAIGILQYEAPWFGKGRFRLTASYNHYGNSEPPGGRDGSRTGGDSVRERLAYAVRPEGTDGLVQPGVCPGAGDDGPIPQDQFTAGGQYPEECNRDLARPGVQGEPGSEHVPRRRPAEL